MRNNDGTINYLLGDHLGSVSTVVDASGQIVSQSRYLPFGELLWEEGTSPTDYTYTGQRSLSDIGLMDYNARFYDPMLGRFTSPDSIVPNQSMSSNWNRYSYVINNPIIYNDSSGHSQECSIGEWWCMNDGYIEVVDKFYNEYNIVRSIETLDVIIASLRTIVPKFDPYIGTYHQYDTDEAKIDPIEMYNKERDGGYSHHDLDKEFAWYYKTHDIDLHDLCEEAYDNPLTQNDIDASGSSALGDWAFVKGKLYFQNANHEAYVEFLKQLKMNTVTLHDYVGEPMWYFNFESNYLDACMNKYPDALNDAIYTLLIADFDNRASFFEKNPVWTYPPGALGGKGGAK